MDQIVSGATEYGLVGLVVAALVYDVFYLQGRLLKALENNTAAMTAVTETVRKCKGSTNA